MAGGTAQNHELKRLLELAGLRRGGTHPPAAPLSAGEGQVESVGCAIRQLPERLRADAAGVAAAVYPGNVSPMLTELALYLPDASRLTLAVAKYFGPKPRTLTVSFMETTPGDLRKRILEHLNGWSGCCGVTFAETNGTGQVRISRAGSGYWSYLGTDILLIPPAQPTMNLQGFTMNTPESEYRRVVRHEAGHTLGFPHEHMRKALVDRIDPQKAYDYFRRTQGWRKEDVDAQVLTPLDEGSILGTPPDQDSIMCYALPAEITKDGKGIAGGRDINSTDCSFAGRVYPRAGAGAAQSAPLNEAEGDRGAPDPVEDLAERYQDHAEDWPEQEDVDVKRLIESFQEPSGAPG